MRARAGVPPGIGDRVAIQVTAGRRRALAPNHTSPRASQLCTLREVHAHSLTKRAMNAKCESRRGKGESVAGHALTASSIVNSSGQLNLLTTSPRSVPHSTQRESRSRIGDRSHKARHKARGSLGPQSAQRQTEPLRQSQTPVPRRQSPPGRLIQYPYFCEGEVDFQ